MTATGPPIRKETSRSRRASSRSLSDWLATRTAIRPAGHGTRQGAGDVVEPAHRTLLPHRTV
jgi:hypothetical protein